MEELLQRLVKGQEQLGWAVEQQLVTAQADRVALRESVVKTIEELQPLRTDPAGNPVREVVRQHPPTPSGISLQKYVAGEDPDAFLINFERVALACGWPLEKWPFFLAPLLTGEAQAAYQVANGTGQTPYAQIKTIILDHLGLDAEAYRARFRKERGSPGENPKTLFFRLKAAADKWLTPALSTKEAIMDKIYLEQYLEALPFGTQRWLRQHSNLTTAQAMEMASTYSRAQPRLHPMEPEKPTRPPVRVDRKPRPPPGFPAPRPVNPDMSSMRGPQCFDCGTWGHIARFCPKKRPAEEPMEVGYLPRAVLFSAELGGAYHHTDAWRSAEDSDGLEPEEAGESCFFNWAELDREDVTTHAPFAQVNAGPDVTQVCYTPGGEGGEADGWRGEDEGERSTKAEEGREQRSKGDIGAERSRETKEHQRPEAEARAGERRRNEETDSDEEKAGSTEGRRRRGETDKPGGHQKGASPSHTSTREVWLPEVRARLPGWAGLKWFKPRK
ncbi:uncharacterized protein LOC144761328 [Lissotriton helveticus]